MSADLEARILEARDRGDTATLRQLQQEYRRTASLIRPAREVCRVSEGSGAPDRLLAQPQDAPLPADTQLPSIVRLMPFARETIEEFPLEWGGECGGMLTGKIDGDEIVVYLAYGNGGDSRGSLNRVSCVLDSEWAVSLDGRSDDLQIVGDWHTHPAGSSPEPSRKMEDGHGDLPAWQEHAKGLRQPYVGLIVTADPEHRWDRPIFHAHITHPQDGTTRAALLILERG